MTVGRSRMDDTEKMLADADRCIWQTGYGDWSKPRGREVQVGTSTYCGKKAVNGNHCSEHHREARALTGRRR